ncbi:MAG TPA: c-type cytochrome domain-containing protein, partial [Polyangiaceae bacterium]|nr:c-type cytochrome domain-containing protein [Polyangiaceae bacterium]
MSRAGAWWKSGTVIGALGAAVIAVIADAVLWRIKGDAPDLALFFGRFHPLVVHLPIGIFLLAGAAEAMALVPALRKRIDPAMPIILPAVVISAIGAFIMGHLLAKGGGFPAQSLLMHRRLTLAAILGSVGCVIAWTYHAEAQGTVSRVIYRGVLGASLGLLSIGAHFGGNMTHGETYLTKYAPGPLRPLLEPEAPKKDASTEDDKPKAGAEPLLYADVVAPILKKNCVECHGSETAKGSLRVDDVEHILKAGDSGPAILPGNGASSLLVRRMQLPKDNDERMPPEGRDGPTPEEIAVVVFWIDRGASETLRVRDALAPDGARKLLEAAAGGAPAFAPATSSTGAPSAGGTAAPVASGATPTDT